MLGELIGLGIAAGYIMPKLAVASDEVEALEETVSSRLKVRIGYPAHGPAEGNLGILVAKKDR